MDTNYSLPILDIDYVSPNMTCHLPVAVPLRQAGLGFNSQSLRTHTLPHCFDIAFYYVCIVYPLVLYCMLPQYSISVQYCTFALLKG